MDRTKAFGVGDYIGDSNDMCWLIEKETEHGFVIVNTLEGIHREITNEPHPRCYWGADSELNYADCYHLLRPAGHRDITEYPIGSEWICTTEHGLNDPKQDIVMIRHYAYSEGVFWICNTERRGILFIARVSELQPVQTKQKVRNE